MNLIKSNYLTLSTNVPRRLFTTMFYGLLSSGAGVFIPYPMFSALNNYIISKIIIKIKNYSE